MAEQDKEQAGHQAMVEDFRKRFFVSLLITVPVLILSPMIQDFFNYTFNFTGRGYVLFLLSTFIYFYGGWPFLTGLYAELREKRPGMMTLIGMAVTTAYIYSSAVVFGLAGRFFFWELATLIVIMLLGHWIEMKSVMGASRALEGLARLMPDEAHLLQGEDVVATPIRELENGDIVLVRPGEKIPADGEIVKGSSYINESMLTGESEPVEKKKGAEVIGGSINGDSSLEIRVTGAGDESYLSRVIDLVRESQEAKSKTQGLADRAALWLTVIAISAGITTLIVWLILGREAAFSIERMATVMVITCPHALGLAIPLVAAVSTTLSAQNGLLIRNRTAFENSRKITDLVFDKTGTLTEGEFGVTAVNTYSTSSPEEILRLAASLERESEHPIARGIVEEAGEKDLSYFNVRNFSAIKGKGVEGEIEGSRTMVVSPGYLLEMDYDLPSGQSEKEGVVTEVFVLRGDILLGSLELTDRIRTSSRETVSRLQDRGINCWMLTGDNEQTAAYVSEKLELNGYFAGVLPHEKQEKVAELQEQNSFVAMTGDGINDAPALAAADVGIAIGSGTDVAAETADIILVDSEPSGVLTLIEFGRATYRKMVQNLAWATGYNAFAIPLAAGVLYNYGIMISPAAGAVLMSLSTVIVAFNARLLRVE
ncbi:MAG: copper-translocating P-type ATPase [Bacillota bacterium]